MRRTIGRGFVLALSAVLGTALTPPFACAADSTKSVVRVAFVDPFSPAVSMLETSAFWTRLQELGWVQGQNMVVDTRTADGHIDRLPALMADVVSRKADVIVTRTTPGAAAAKNATTAIPIVVASMGDPIGTGLVPSLAHPGGNLTGLSLAQGGDLAGKWLELLKETLPRLHAIAVIANPNSLYVRKISGDLKDMAHARRLKLIFVNVSEVNTLASAFARARHQAQAVLVLGDPLTVSHREEVTALAASNRLPAIYPLLSFANAGGLMAYGQDYVLQMRRAAEYVDKILRGAKAADLPIEQPTQFQLIVNLKTAKALGITFPESILARADQVIQ